MQRAAQILRIEPLLKRQPKQLSGGQRQRVAIGRAIVREPRIFLFDEPLSNLDAELRVQMRVEIAKLHRDLGNTMIYVTHDQIEAMTMADKIVVLHSGVIEQVGAPLDLYNSPAQPVRGRLHRVAEDEFPRRPDRGDGRRRSTQIAAAGSTIELPRAVSAGAPGDEVTFGVRPEHIGLAADDGVPLADVRVELVEHLGGQTMLYTTTADKQTLTIAVDGQQQVVAGASVTAYVDPARYHVFAKGSEAI